MHYIFGLFTIGIGLFSIDGNSRWPPWLFLELGVALSLAAYIWSRLHWSAGIAVAYTLINGFLFFGIETPLIVADPNKSGLAFDKSAMGATIAFLSLTTFFTFACNHILKKIEWGFGVLCVLASLITFIDFMKGLGPDQMLGFMGNSSMNGCLIALTWPFLVMAPALVSYNESPIDEMKGKDWLQVLSDILLMVMPLIAIFQTRQSVPLGVASVVLFTYIASKNSGINLPNPSSRRIIAAGICTALLFFAATAMTPKLLHDSGRFAIWKMAWSWFETSGQMTWGTGNGSFFLIGPSLLETMNVNKGGHMFAWLHNDWFQSYFELGFVGLLAYLNLFVCALIRSFKQGSVHLSCALLGYGACAFFNFPSHLAITAFLGFFLIARIFRYGSEC
jgi:hypothetical protein